MQILITNYMMRDCAGTELYVRDLAGELLRRGHQPVVYTPRPGRVSQEIRQAGITVTSDLAETYFNPDIIHGHHWHETMAAVLRFPDVPAVAFCHDAKAPCDRASVHPNIRRYVAVDLVCRERLLSQGIDPSRIELLMNFADLRRFLPRPPLPDRPQRALLFSNSAVHLGPVKEACRLAGLTLDVVGLGVNRPLDCPEQILGRYDLVFAKARAAIEAMAVGTAVLLCDQFGCGVMVTGARFDQLRPLNFGRQALTGPLDPQEILKQIHQYDPRDAQQVCRRVRGSASLEQTTQQLEQIYNLVIDEHRHHKPSAQQQRRAVARYLNEPATRLAGLENLLPQRLKSFLLRIPVLGWIIRRAARFIHEPKIVRWW